MRFLSLPPWPAGAALDDRIDAVCDLNQMDRRTVLRRTGLLAGPHLRPGWGRWLPDTAVATLALAVDVSPQVVRSSLLEHFTNVCFPHGAVAKPARQLIWDAWAFPSGTRICPECWTNCGYEPTRHRLPWSFVCLEHAVFLVDRCSGCDRRFRSGKDNDRSGPSILSVQPRPGRCSNQQHRTRTRSGMGSRPCDHPYVGNRVFSASSDALRTQETINAALDGHPPALLGESVSPLEFFDDLRSIAALACTSAPQEDTQPTHRPYLRPPRTSSEMATACQAALEVLSNTDTRTAGQLLLGYVEADLNRYQSTTRALIGRTQPTERTKPVLDATISLVGRPTTRLRRSVQPTLPLHGIDPEQVSMQTAAALYERHVQSRIASIGRLRPDLGIATLAMDLTRLAGLPSYPTCAEHLGLDQETWPRRARYVRSRLAAAGLIDTWITAVGEAAGRLQPQPTLPSESIWTASIGRAHR